MEIGCQVLCESVKCSNDADGGDFGPSPSQKGSERARIEVSASGVDDVVDLTKNDDLRTLEQYLGNTGLTLTPDDPTSISEVVNRFLENVFFIVENQVYTMLNMQTSTRTPQRAWKDVNYRHEVPCNNHFDGPCQEDKTIDYWSTNKLIDTPILVS